MHFMRCPGSPSFRGPRNVPRTKTYLGPGSINYQQVNIVFILAPHAKNINHMTCSPKVLYKSTYIYLLILQTTVVVGRTHVYADPLSIRLKRIGRFGDRETGETAMNLVILNSTM